jgi:hypothetical protein
MIYSAHVTKLSLSLSVRLQKTTQHQVSIHQYRHLPSLMYRRVRYIPFWSLSENKVKREMNRATCSVYVRVPDYHFIHFRLS